MFHVVFAPNQQRPSVLRTILKGAFAAPYAQRGRSLGDNPPLSGCKQIMPIQWFPGHMASARKQAARTLAEVDVVLELVDARLPQASANPLILDLRRIRQRPCLRVLNKADLADPAVTAQWQKHISAQPDLQAVALSAKDAAAVRRLPALCQKLAPLRGDGVKPLRVMVMGIPNVGKSTLINALAQRRIAAVGDEPAVTRQEQRIELTPGLVLVDTPGLMWPKIEHDSDGYMLAASHAIGVNALNEEEVAQFLGAVLLRHYAGLLLRRYGWATQPADSADLLHLIAQKRGCILRGGVADLEKAARVLLNDYRSGALGRISLESPESRQRLLMPPSGD